MSAATIDQLPDSILWQILSNLSGQDLANNISLVNKRWYWLSLDHLLWKHMLIKESHQREHISSSSCPDSLLHLRENLSARYVWQYCNWMEKKHLDGQQSIDAASWMHFMKSRFIDFLSRRRWLSPAKPAPKFCLLGPGLESDTYNIVREVIQGRGILKVKTYFPSAVGGPLGSGMTMELQSDQTAPTFTFDLAVLYSSCKKMRTAANMGGYHNLCPPLYRVQQASSASPEAPTVDSCQYSISSEFYDLLKIQQAIVFAVDANMPASMQVWCRTEASLLCEAAEKLNIPLLVLSLVRDVHSERTLSAYDMTKLLQLDRATWCVHNVITNGLWGVETAFHWLQSTLQA